MLEMSEKFTNDTFGNNLNLFPLVVITYLSGENLHISTNNVSFGGNYYKPILLNVPNIKESIDLENRNYKISNANLSISNFPVNGEVFSDSLLDSSGNYIINAEVDIYWKSQSCTSLEDCLHIYHGVVRRVKHDSDKVTLSIEDLSQKELHKDLPSTYLPDDDTVLEKNKNKPIPMVYGYVDKSPCMIDNVLEEYQDGNYDIAIDTQDITLNGDNPLWVYRDDTWVQILKESLYFANYGYDYPEQYSIDNNEIILLAKYGQGDAINSIADNRVEGLHTQKAVRGKEFREVDKESPPMWEEYGSPNTFFYIFFIHYSEGLDDPSFLVRETYGLSWSGVEDPTDPNSGYLYLFTTDNYRKKTNYQFNTPLDGNVVYDIDIDYTLSNYSSDDGRSLNVRIEPASGDDSIIRTHTSAGNYSIEGAINTDSLVDLAITVCFPRPDHDFEDMGGHSCNVDFTLNELYANIYTMLDKFLTSDFYADVYGRNDTEYTGGI